MTTAGPHADTSAPLDGLFAADSIAWRLHADPSMLIGGLRALMIQATEPRAMAGVSQHSDYRVDPWGRLQRTTDFVLSTTYGDLARAERSIAKVRGVHRRVNGTDPVTGRPYSANDPELIAWVHHVELDSFVAAYRAYGGRLRAADTDRYVAEMRVIPIRLGGDESMIASTFDDVRQYLRTYEGLRVSPDSRESFRMLVAPPMPAWVRPLWGVVFTAAIAITPSRIRRLYGVPWVPIATPVVRAAVIPLIAAMNLVIPPGPIIRDARARAAAAGRRLAS